MHERKIEELFFPVVKSSCACVLVHMRTGQGK
jgi:hypothetical protein